MNTAQKLRAENTGKPFTSYKSIIGMVKTANSHGHLEECFHGLKIADETIEKLKAEGFSVAILEGGTIKVEW